MTYAVLWWVPIEDYTELKKQWNLWVPFSCTHTLLSYQRPCSRKSLEHGHLIIGSHPRRLTRFISALDKLPPNLKSLWLAHTTDDLLESLRTKIDFCLPLPMTKSKMKNLQPHIEAQLKTITTHLSHLSALTLADEYLYITFDQIAQLEYTGTLLRVYYRNGERKKYTLANTDSHHQWKNHHRFFVVNQAQGIHMDSILSLVKIPHQHYLCRLKGGHTLPLTNAEVKRLLQRFDG